LRDDVFDALSYDLSLENANLGKSAQSIKHINRIHSQGTTVEGTPKRQSWKGTVVARLGREEMGREKRECRWVPPASGVDANTVQEPRFLRRKTLPGQRLGRRRQHLILRIRLTRKYPP
jgi:hypothetical protein